MGLRRLWRLLRGCKHQWEFVNTGSKDVLHLKCRLCHKTKTKVLHGNP
jgi:hypothetical protein